MRLLLTIISIAFTTETVATTYSREMLFATGMISTSFSENEVELDTSGGGGGNIATPVSGSASSLALAGKYRFNHDAKYGYYVNGNVPLVGGGGTSFFSAGGGMEFYFGALSTKIRAKDEDFNFFMLPGIRYWAGFGANVGYLVYTTETAQKSDVLFEIILNGGADYHYSKRWGVFADVAIARGSGVTTTTTGFKILVGSSFYLDF